MAPKTGAPQGKMKKKIQVAVTKAVEKKKTCCPLPNLALSTPGRSLAPGRHRKKHATRSVKAGLHFPIGQIERYLKEGRYYQCIGSGAPVYLAAVLEYLTAKVLELVGQAAKDSKKIRIIPRHVMLDVMRDEELNKMLAGITIAHGGVLPNIHESLFGDGTVEDATNLPAEDAPKSPEKITESP
uniref:Uncharacterized protein n=1 Tax=Avena sativa TaxID=4498 RepID=A0ACD5UZK4_AVESA